MVSVVILVLLGVLSLFFLPILYIFYILSLAVLSTECYFLRGSFMEFTGFYLKLSLNFHGYPEILFLVSRNTCIGPVIPKFSALLKRIPLCASCPRSSTSSLLSLLSREAAHHLLLLDSPVHWPDPGTHRRQQNLPPRRHAFYCVETWRGRGREPRERDPSPPSPRLRGVRLPPAKTEAGTAPYLTQLSRNLLCCGWFK